MSGLFSFFTVVAFVVLVCLPVAFVMFRVVFSGNKTARRAAHSYADEAEDLALRAGQRLLQADEVVRAARDEADFAEASLGAVRAEPFRQLVIDAEQVVAAAFADNARLAFLEGVEKSSLARQIIERVDTVLLPVLDAQQNLAALRGSEASVEERVKKAEGLLGDFESRIGAAEEKLQSLELSFSPAALSSIHENPSLASRRIAAAREALARASDSSASREVAAQAVETAERALFDAGQALDAVFHAEDQIEDVLASLSDQIASLTSDLADVQRLDADEVAFAPLVSRAHRVIEQAQEARSGRGDVLAACADLSNAEADLDAALAPLRSREEHDERLKANAQRFISLARGAVADAERAVSRADRGASGASYEDLSQARQDLRQAEYLLPFDQQGALKAADRAAMKARSILFTQRSSTSSSLLPGGFAGSLTGDM